MFFGQHLKPGVPLDAAAVAPCNGVLHVTGASLSDGQHASLFLKRPSGERFAAARVSASSPCAHLSLTYDLAADNCLLEVEEGALQVVGFVEPQDLESTGGKEPPKKKARTAPEAPATSSAQTSTKVVADSAAPKKAEPLYFQKPGVTPPQTTAPVKTPPAEEAKSKASADFVPSKTFTGSKPGMVFKKGPQGLGYYKDVNAPKPGAQTDQVQAGAKVTLQGGLVYEVKAPPKNNASPKATRGANVQVRYEGRLAKSGKRFDKGLIKFKLGAGEVIKGWDLGVEGMRVGERRTLFIPAKLGYGSSGAPPDIPPNAGLTFDIELNSTDAPSLKRANEDRSGTTSSATGKGSRVSLQGGLVYEVKTAPKNSTPKAARGQSVQVRYEGRLAKNGKRFDKGSIRFRLGRGEVIKGWDLGVEGMRVGERRTLLIPPALGYGSRGAPPQIPPNAALTFDVELLRI